MAVESTTASPLSDLTDEATPLIDIDDLVPHDDEEDSEDDIDPRTPKERQDAGTAMENLISYAGDINLARYLDDIELSAIGMQVVREYNIDKQSRSEWEEKAMKAMKFATQDPQPKQYPWPGASSMIFPLITEAALDFGARTMPAIIQGKSIVKGVVWGSDRGTPTTADGQPDGQPIMGANGQPIWLIPPGAKRARADRIGEHMSWQLLREMPEWQPQTDTLIHQIPIIGGAVRKTFYDPIEGRSKSLFVSLLNIVWNYHATSFDGAARHTEKLLLYPHEIIEYERMGATDDEDGMFLHVNYGPGGGDASGETFNGETIGSSDMDDEDAPHLFIEQHRRIDMDGDGYPEPYIVTVHLRSSKVVRIIARFDEDCIKAGKDGATIISVEPDSLYTLYPFLPSFDGGSYPTGFGHLLRPLNEAINTTLNQSFDAGHLQNAGGGFISDQLGIPSGQTLFQVGKYTRVTAKGQAIRDAVMPLPFQGPSPVLFQILGFIVNSAQKIAGLGSVLTGDAAIANAPPTTVLALIEQGMKTYTSICQRVFIALESELNKLYKLNKRHVKTKAEYQSGEDWKEISADDYRLGSGVSPVADPKATTDMQKLVRSQVIMTTANDPLVNRKEALTRMYEAAGVERIDDLFSPPDPTAAQLAMAKGQAEIGAIRAKELRDQSQAFLNMALAKKNASSGQEAFIEQQLKFMRLNIESINAQVRAASVDHAFHQTGLQDAQHHSRLAHERTASQAEMDQEARLQAADHAHQLGIAALASAPQPADGPTGDFPVPPDDGAPSADQTAGAQ